MFEGLRSLFAAEGAARDPSDDRFFSGMGKRSEIDVQVTVKRARKIPVVRSSLKILAESVAGLEFGVSRRQGGRTEALENHPVALLLNDPNRRQTSFDFVFQVVDDLCAEGDHYSEIVLSEFGEILELRRIEPSRVVVEETRDGAKRFRTFTRWGEERVLLEEEVWHLALPPLEDNLKGTSPILVDGREAVAVAIALQRYANILFTNDATPPYAFSMPGHFKDADSRKNMLASITRWVSGKNRHKPGILEHDLKPHRLGLTAEEAQFLETRRELWLDLARLWRIPPHKLGILDKATFSNIEHQSLEFVTDTLRPILELIERSINKFLIAERDVFFEFNVASLLRGDLKSRYEAYALGRQWGWLSVNDVLKQEHRNGIGAPGDRYMEPLNMVPVGTGAAEREPQKRAAIDRSIDFLRESTKANNGRPRLELVKDAA